MDFNDYIEASKMQELVNSAHDKCSAKRVSFKELINGDHLLFLEDIAMIAGKLYAQVNNGGFLQWCDNGYADKGQVDFLLSCVKTDAVSEVVIMAERAITLFQDIERAYDEYEYYEPDTEEIDRLTSAFYEINEQFFRDVNEWLLTLDGEQ